ncbi:MAG: acyltransferase family protein [Lacinutrix sp.]|uniref:acyltransferase n=1 Tax=Lacinutrix sp. TaxID=1937692 RepID=UPI0030B3E7FF
MISGALLLDKDYQLNDFLSKRVLRILPPFIFWSLIYVFYDAFILGSKSYEFFEFLNLLINKLLHGSQYHLSFIYTLLGLYLFIPILIKWIKHVNKKEIRYFLIIWSFTILFATSNFNKFLPKIELMNFSGFLGYMVLGYYLSKLKPIKKYKLIFLFSMGVIFTILITYSLTKEASNFNGSYYWYLTPNVLVSSAAIFLFFKDIVNDAPQKYDSAFAIVYNTAKKHKEALNVLSRLSNIDGYRDTASYNKQLYTAYLGLGKPLEAKKYATK